MSDHCEDTPSRPVLCKLSFSYVLEAELLAHRTLSAAASIHAVHAMA